MRYVLGIDIGNTNTTAAVSRSQGTAWSHPEIVKLDTRSYTVPSVLHMAPNGALTVGDPAQYTDLVDGTQVARGFLRRIGDEVPVHVGEEACSPQALTAVL